MLLYYYTLTSVISPSLMPLLLVYPKTLGNICSNLFLPPCCHIFLIYIMGFDIAIHQRIEITCSHASHCHHCIYCHYCNVNLVLFHNVKCYTNFLLSHIHANTTNHFNTTCMILVATCMILGRLELMIVVKLGDRFKFTSGTYHPHDTVWTAPWPRRVVPHKCWLPRVRYVPQKHCTQAKETETYWLKP